MATPSAAVGRSSARKTFIPLENNPTIMSSLATTLGISPHTLTFHDIYSLHPPDLTHIPRPVHALFFLCPATIYHRARSHVDVSLPIYTGSGSSEPVLWFKQTIRHACGLMALLHGLANSSYAETCIAPDSTLDRLLKAAVDLMPEERARLLYESPELEVAHMAAAVQGDTVAPDAAEENHQHFICFVKGRDGHLWELNGGMRGPVDWGGLREGEDVLSERVLGLGVRSFLDLPIGGQEEERKEELNFSLVAMASEVLND